MKILLLADESGIEMQLFKSTLNDLVLRVQDTSTGTEIMFTLNDEDRESLICELARLRNVSL